MCTYGADCIMISENMSYLVEKKLFNKDTRSNHSVAILEAKLNTQEGKVYEKILLESIHFGR